MTIANINLTEIQRQQLLEILSRRFKKMTDHALLELERLTRHPVDLVGFEAKTSNLVPAKAVTIESNEKRSENVIDGVFSEPINRREFLAYPISALLLALSGGLGYGLSKSNASVKDLSSTLEDVDFGVSNLKETIIELEQDIYNCSLVMSEYLDTYQSTLNSIAQLGEHTEMLQGLLSQLDTTGMTLAEMIQKAFDLLGLLPKTENFAGSMSTMMETVRNIPDTISLAKNAIGNLSLWFSNEHDQGISNRLLNPTGLIFHIVENEIKPKVDVIQSRLSGL